MDIIVSLSSGDQRGIFSFKITSENTINITTGGKAQSKTYNGHMENRYAFFCDGLAQKIATRPCVAKTRDEWPKMVEIYFLLHQTMCDMSYFEIDIDLF